MKKSIGAKTIVYPNPVFIVGTYDKDEIADVMAVAWGGLSCSNPPCISISIQKHRYTYKNIVEKKAFTINIPPKDYVNEADYFGIVSGKNVDKFEASGLTAVKSEIVDAPYVDEFPLTLECRLVKSVDLGTHTQFTGEIIDVKVDENAVDSDGIPDINKINPFIYDPAGMKYYSVGKNLGSAFNLGNKIKNQL